MKKVYALIICIFSLSLQAAPFYYPSSYQEGFAQRVWSGETLKDKLFFLLTKNHIFSPGQNDVLSSRCPAKKRCYSHKNIGYKRTRQILFGRLHLQRDTSGYYVHDVYCRKKFRGPKIGPLKIPNHMEINTEHSWPKFKFVGSSTSRGYQLTDLHHLFPTDNKANHRRGHGEFAELNTNNPLNNCQSSYAQGSHFEPPEEHKGNVARALFYFAVRYKGRISSSQESVLKRWHREDPVDRAELARNEGIMQAQGNRNPFIDYPELVDLISNF